MVNSQIRFFHILVSNYFVGGLKFTFFYYGSCLRHARSSGWFTPVGEVGPDGAYLLACVFFCVSALNELL